MRTFFIAILLLCLPSFVLAQDDIDINRLALERRVVDKYGDTIPCIVLPPIFCGAPRFRNERQRRKYFEEYARTIYNIKKVYPYVQAAKQKLAEMDAEFVKIKDPKAKKAYINMVEKEMFKEFEKPLKKLTVSQGRLLIKMLDRETGRTGYQIIKELKGGFSAFFWQSIALLFDSSLKSTFDAEGQDMMLDQLITWYESGLL